ncbi:PspC domain-containing protein [Rhodococcus spelaei]|uniref:PspC domain-containing protein n=1 Tax=Rhodococcus spelaei TaxID=2546320 RepID=A0A541BRA4_9NOCA|nr:PspC domain-containing protein [Rhodococcus spelaei]TQF74829.1 PspC domain-containing protein [Rhodococcus spelaei]
MTFDSNTTKPFARSTTQRMLGGVCGGIAEYFGVDANLVRAGAVLAAFATGGTAVLVYLALWMLLPA